MIDENLLRGNPLESWSKSNRVTCKAVRGTNGTQIVDVNRVENHSAMLGSRVEKLLFFMRFRGRRPYRTGVGVEKVTVISVSCAKSDPPNSGNSEPPSDRHKR